MYVSTTECDGLKQRYARPREMSRKQCSVVRVCSVQVGAREFGKGSVGKIMMW